MKPSESESALRHRLGAVEAVTPRRAIDAMLAFYAEERAEDVAIDEDGEMLLYEWGVYNFTGPESFRFGISRQFIVTDEDEPYQLHLTLHFAPADALRRLGNDNEWCHSPDELPEFRQSIESSAPYKALGDAKPSRPGSGGSWSIRMFVGAAPASCYAETYDAYRGYRTHSG